MRIEEVSGELIPGIYKLESKRRFSCEVEVNGKIESCYVASSAKLEQFIELKNKKVKLSINNASSKFKYSLWSVEHEGKEILLNLKKVNELIEILIIKENLLKKSYTSIKKEKYIKNFKSDLLLETENDFEIVEIKTVITDQEKAIFPNLNSKRSVEQLKKIQELLKQGYKVKYIIAALSPYIETVELNPEYLEFTRLFKQCKFLGMEVLIVKLYQINKEIKYSFL